MFFQNLNFYLFAWFNTESGLLTLGWLASGPGFLFAFVVLIDALSCLGFPISIFNNSFFTKAAFKVCYQSSRIFELFQECTTETLR